MNRKQLPRLTAFVFSLFFVVNGFSQQTGTWVKGKIVGKDSLPLIGVTIQLKGKPTTTLTDAGGEFKILSPQPSGILVVTMVGFQEREIKYNGAENLDIRLEESVSMLHDVILTGYLKQKKSDITGAISSILNRDFKDQPVSNVAQSIQGKLAGILVTTPSGTPGAGLLVSIRGANNPLYVVDGVPMISQSNSSLSTSYNTNGEEQGKGQDISSISDINPDDIESIEVLKDASSASIYGSRAANGVVLITTKRGRAGKTDFSFNSFAGIQEVPRKIPFLSSDQLVALEEDARAQDLIAYQQDPAPFEAAYPGFDPAVLTNPLPDSWKTGVNTNWENEIFRTAPIANLQLSARGGNDKTKFFVAGNYFDQQGIVIDNFYKRGSFRMNLDNKVTDRVSFGTNIAFTYSNNRRTFNDDTYTGVVTNAIGASPLMPVYNPDGTYSDYTQYQASWLSDNPVKSAKEVKAYTTSYRFLGTVFADIQISAPLKFHTSFNADYTDLTDDQFFDPTTSDGSSVGGKAINGIYNNLTWLNENNFIYQNGFGKNHINGILGLSLQSSRYTRASTHAQGFPAGSGLENISSASTITAATNQSFGWGLVSYIGRINYDFDEKYLFSASLRYDGSSRFPPDGRWGAFPAFSAGWILTKEAFLADSKWLSSLKLRASYGQTGDQEIGDFQYQAFWAPSRYYGVAGLRPQNLGDPNLTWQRNKMVDLGLDFEMYNGRISGSVDWFQGNRTKLLAEAVVPPHSGFYSQTTNAGNIRNTGVEFSVIGYPFRSPDFTWSIGFNISFLQEKILSLYTNNELLSAYIDLFPTHILQIGQSEGTFWGYKYLGVDPQTGNPKYSDDQQVLGKARPDYFGGFTNDFKYHNWDMNISTQFSVGNKVYNLIRTTYQTLGWSDGGWDENNSLYQVYANNATIVNKRWEKPGDKTDIPRASLIFPNYVQNSSQFIEDASFFRIRTVSVGYTFKPKKPGVYKSLRVYVQAQNLYVFTKYYGFDPEVSSNGGSSPETAGVDYAAYPQARTYTFGVNFNF
jgi:TonB-dependent starch-binding outer membrane protein SusC